ncbi:hypothetical protein ACFXKS_04350 [Streptomyces scopuliridis]
MENEAQVEHESGGDDLLVARQQVNAARSRMSTPSDNTGGRTDMND